MSLTKSTVISKANSSSFGEAVVRCQSYSSGHRSMRLRVCPFTCFIQLTLTFSAGLTLEQVDELYGMVSKAWKSKEFRPAVSFREAQVEGQSNMDIRQMSVAQSER